MEEKFPVFYDNGSGYSEGQAASRTCSSLLSGGNTDLPVCPEISSVLDKVSFRSWPGPRTGGNRPASRKPPKKPQKTPRLFAGIANTVRISVNSDRHTGWLEICLLTAQGPSNGQTFAFQEKCSGSSRGKRSGARRCRPSL